MNNFFKKIFRKVTLHPYISAVGAVVMIAGGAFAYRTLTGEPQFDTVKAERKDIVQQVSVTGKVKAAKEISLAFEKTGKAARVNGKAGTMVKAGQVLAFLENQDARAKVREAEAAVQLQEAKLEETKKGARLEEIAIQDAKVRASERGLEDARRSFLDAMQDAYTKSDDAIRNTVDQLFSNAQTSEPPYKFLGANPQLELDVESGRQAAEALFQKWETELADSPTASDLNIHEAAAEKNLRQIKLYVDKVALLANSFSATPPYTQTTVDGWKADMSGARSAIYTAITNLASAQKQFEAAKYDLEIKRRELALKRAGATLEAVKIAEAGLAQARAGLQAAAAELAKTIIRAPIAGIITKRNIEPGEIIQAQNPALAMISESDFEIEANVPEADIAKLERGQRAAITLDAYGDETVFEGKVAHIDPAETVIDGVPTYLIKIHFVPLETKSPMGFAKKDARIKSGLTANIDILIARREQVIAAPTRAVINRGNEKIVKVLEGERAREVQVETGLRGSDGNTEIIQGVKEGDQIIIDDDE